MATPLNVIALISGGKDSFFSILHCLANGHNVVALANLHPPAPRRGAEVQDDMNSFMYQTVGHDIIPLYAEALGLPLYRQEIWGLAVDQNRDYPVRRFGASPAELRIFEHDETESLVPLLYKVMAAHPNANAVSTGAILSTYQRTRVESVALRLGLTPLSYLWQYPYLPPYNQSALLRDMAAVGQDARIIKTASGGLDESFLYENVAEPKTIARLHRVMSRFGDVGQGAVIGEGGEYETLAIDGPAPVWKKRIEAVTDYVVNDAGTSIWKGKEVRLVEKEQDTENTLRRLRIPDMWDDESKEILATLKPLSSLEHTAQLAATEPTPVESRFSTISMTGRHYHGAHIFTISNLTHLWVDDAYNRHESLATHGDVFSQMHVMLQYLLIRLIKIQLSQRNILHVTLLLRDMSAFPAANAAYSQHLNCLNPPSRVTVSCGNLMPAGVDVMLSAIISKSASIAQEKDGLHVQSRSYWAPQNIGPYSQAISIPLSSPATEENWGYRAVYLAGQIPLVPASMELVEETPFQGQAVLALQHLFRIGRTVGVNWWTAGLAYISSCPEPAANSRIRTAQNAWNLMHQFKEPCAGDEQEAEIDPWDLLNLSRALQPDPFDLSDLSRVLGPGSTETHRAALPDQTVLQKPEEGVVPPCFGVMVSSLPRGAGIEFASTGLSLPPASLSTTNRCEKPLLYTAEAGSAMFLALEITEKENVGSEYSGFGEIVKSAFMDLEHTTVFMGPDCPKEWTFTVKGGAWVPCEKVWGADGREISGVLLARVTLK